MKNKLKILTTILTISALSLTSAYANPTITILESAEIGTFINTNNEYTVNYSYENRPEYGFDVFAVYNNTKYQGLDDAILYASDTKEELIQKINIDVSTSECQQWAANSMGSLNNNNNFFSVMCPSEALGEHIDEIYIESNTTCPSGQQNVYAISIQHPTAMLNDPINKLVLLNLCLGTSEPVVGETKH